MIPNDFYGKKQFIWWTGVVEDIQDPLKLGSVRVRIIGLHSENKSLVPTDSLPWAQVALPTTGAKSVSGPREGDWVFGFFQDGEYAQIPVVLSVFPGIESAQSSIVYQESVRREGAANKPVSTQVDRVVGEPTTYRISRGVMQGTLVNATNQQRKHVCDITPEVTKAVSYVKGKFNVVIKELRDLIRILLAKLGFDGSGEISKLVQLAKAIAREIKYLTDIVKEVNELVGELVVIATQIRAMIDYILSLPEKARKFLAECLQRFTEALAKGYTDLLTPPEFSSPIGDFKEITDAVKDVQSAANDLTNELQNTVGGIGSIGEALINPASATDIAAIGTDFEQYVSSITPSKETIEEQYAVTVDFLTLRV
jgi:methyl-accepting chemotaxis protein